MSSFIKEFKTTQVKEAKTSVTNSTTTATTLSSGSYSRVLLQARATNTDIIYFGDSASQYMELAPGESVLLHVRDLIEVYHKSGSGTQKLHYYAT